MTSFLRFFVLALTPLLGVTGSFGPALLFGLVATLLLAGSATLVFFARDSLKDPWLLWSALGLGVLLVTAVDLVTGLAAPGIRAAWGPYLNLLAFSPLVVLVPIEKPKAPDLVTELSLALKTGLLLTGLFVVTSLVREVLGHGTLTLVPGSLAWELAGLKDYPLAILATGAGGFFLAAAMVVGYRALGPRLTRLSEMADFLVAAPGPAPAAPTPQPPIPKAPKPPKAEKQVPVKPAPAPAVPKAAPVVPEPAEDWGETLASTVADLSAGNPGEKRRLLVIGSGNGELAYYLAMLCLNQAKSDRNFSFRIRGVDHFSTRVDTAVKGVFREHQIDFIPPAIREAWMTRGQGDERHLWKVGAEPRLHVQFEVADFNHGEIFFLQPCHLVVLNQGIEYVTDEKKVQLLNLVCSHLAAGGALVVPGPFKRDLLPDGMKRTGTTVFRKA